MATGTEMLIAQVFKMLGLDAEKTKAQIADIGQFVVSVRGDLARLEANQLAIMRHLGITAPVPPVNGQIVEIQTTKELPAKLD